MVGSRGGCAARPEVLVVSVKVLVQYAHSHTGLIRVVGCELCISARWVRSVVKQASNHL